MNPLKQGRWAYLALGLALGWIVCAEVLDRRPTIRVDATATQGLDNFAIATGLVASGMEALYFLDYLTGDLKGAVISEKTGKFNALFHRNIAQDFGGITKNPRYLMVTGLADIPRGSSQFQLAQSIVYVAEASTGQVAAYAMPWNQSVQASGRPQQGTFERLDLQQFRTVYIRDQQ